MTEPIALLLSAVQDADIIDAPEAGDGFVHGRARLDAAGADVAVNIDPDLDEDPDVDPQALLAGVSRVLGISERRWSALVDEIAGEIEDAVDGDVAEQTDLREDLAIVSIAVLPDATLLSFTAPKQFPDSWIRVQLDEDLEFEDLSVDEKDDIEKDDVETVSVGSLDELLDRLTDEG